MPFLSLMLQALATGLSAISLSSTTVESINGEWGFVSVQPADDWLSVGFLGGAGECGHPKALNLKLGQETNSSGVVEWRLRLNPAAPYGALVTAVDVGPDSVILTVEAPGPIESVTEKFQRKGDILMWTDGAVQREFKRCKPK